MQGIDKIYHLVAGFIISLIFGLINDYNGAKVGLFDEETNQKYIDAYNEFLTQRKAIKEQIDLDWNNK